MLKHTLDDNAPTLGIHMRLGARNSTAKTGMKYQTAINKPGTKVLVKPRIRHFIPATNRTDRDCDLDGTKGAKIGVHNCSLDGRYVEQNTTKKDKRYLILWYNPPNFLKLRQKAFTATFSGCEFSNCQITYDRHFFKQTECVIFDGRRVPEKLEYKRPLGQIWIFAAHEAPVTYDDLGNWWTKPQWLSSFNWTMMYDAENSDIYLPYGEIRPSTLNVYRNFTEIALNKKKTAIAIISHCITHSRRELYIRKLSRYIDIDVLGACGKPWKCGKRYLHDGCFQILNSTYKFFLAFENALCRQYFTEKLFENFNYDVVPIVYGGQSGDLEQHLPEGTYISTNQYKSVHELGKYLQSLTWSIDKYTELLQKKSRYKAEGFEVVYKRALCDVCRRMNKQEGYRKTISNIKSLVYKRRICSINPI